VLMVNNGPAMLTTARPDAVCTSHNEAPVVPSLCLQGAREADGPRSPAMKQVQDLSLKIAELHMKLKQERLVQRRAIARGELFFSSAQVMFPIKQVQAELGSGKAQKVDSAQKVCTVEKADQEPFLVGTIHRPQQASNVAATGIDMASSSANASANEKDELVQPMKPANAFFMWLGEHREKMKSELGKVSMGGLTKVAGERWRNMSVAEKAPWKNKAEVNKAEYGQALREFFTRGGILKIKPRRTRGEKGRDMAKRARKRKHNNEKAAGKPSRPHNAFWTWLRENRQKFVAEAGSGRFAKIGKLAGERWKMLSVAEKAPYEKEAAHNKNTYLIAYENWRASSGAQEADVGNEDDDGGTYVEPEE